MLDCVRDNKYNPSVSGAVPVSVGGNTLFWSVKRAADIAGSLMLLPFFLLAAVVLLLLNPFKNRGPLFFTQTRMGRDCRPFEALKFRSMAVAVAIERGHDDPIEHHRITSLGRLMRKSRIDELPQILNVLKGEMSLLGPRPDYFPHAQAFLECVPGYRERHCVRPGISGLAQVSLGYIEGSDATRAKVRKDLEYIQNVSILTENQLVLKTIRTVFGRAGA
ncbi:sugar transferase [Candidatus Halocynthiibacter alkanivorans]|uniref:sugar transferase n=1 Tax=Candidatus Halocynthiibacter alkanivorans TaxID=2267619 RepID=UPI000DF297E0|nr:sugar transferase [Candidatus Halocynthiibacter alkanivorans]